MACEVMAQQGAAAEWHCVGHEAEGDPSSASMLAHTGEHPADHASGTERGTKESRKDHAPQVNSDWSPGCTSLGTGDAFCGLKVRPPPPSPRAPSALLPAPPCTSRMKSQALLHSLFSHIRGTWPPHRVLLSLCNKHLEGSLC